MDHPASGPETTKASLEAMKVWQRELTDNEKRTIASGEMGLRDQLDLAEQRGIVGEASQYAFISKLDALSRGFGRVKKTLRGTIKKSKATAGSAKKAEAIAEGLWEKATPKERIELATMTETKLGEMAVMFGVRGPAQYVFSAVIGKLSKKDSMKSN
jgi:hypothetical protein